ncbi:hypothetical protein J3458_021471 [Metarhizium acridum]|uniref:uncharacterized protein n=1 Tax=Metarhizium acridum TaxID=92637 RepID=UPI001C6BF629|nr:hypothetical protein J3458_021471 [Metarhizium acridum]
MSGTTFSCWLELTDVHRVYIHGSKRQVKSPTGPNLGGILTLASTAVVVVWVLLVGFVGGSEDETLAAKYTASITAKVSQPCATAGASGQVRVWQKSEFEELCGYPAHIRI